MLGASRHLLHPSSAMPPLLFTLRVIVYTVLLLSVSFVSLFIALVSTILGKRLNTNYYVARTFYRVTGPIIGWKFEVEGEEYLWSLKHHGGQGAGDAREGGRSAVLVGNHQSFVDILYLGRIFPKHAAIMAKKSIRWYPGLGWWMMMSGTVFVNRSNRKAAIASMNHVGDEMKRKRISLWVFPEGTRHMSQEPELLPFKKGAFYLAVQAGVPIIPVVCQNYYHLFNGKTWFRRGTLRLKVLPPIPTAGLTASDVPVLIEKTRDAMLEALYQISARPPPTPDLSRPIASPTPLLSALDGPDAKYSDASPDRSERETQAPMESPSESLSDTQLEGVVVGLAPEFGSGTSEGRRRNSAGKKHSVA